MAIKVVESSFIGLPLTRPFLKYCTETFSIRNPEFDNPNRDRTKEIPEIIRGYEVDFATSTIRIKRGLKNKVIAFLYKNNIEYEIKDVTIRDGADISFEFENSDWHLLDYQKLSIDIFLKKGQGVISFDCGMGKTITALNIACQLKVKTIVLVHTTPLQLQWIDQIQKNVKGEFTTGMIGGGAYSIGDITVVLFQSFRTLGNDEIFSKFGFVIVDECHHIPAETFYDVITKFRSKFILGLSATLRRKDKKEFLIDFSIGPLLYEKHREDTGIKQTLFVRKILEIPKVTRKVDKKTKMVETKPFKISRAMPGSRRRMPNWVDAIGAVCYLQTRTNEIISDITNQVKQGRKCLVLSNRVEHCKQIYSTLQPYCKVKLAIGGDNDNLDVYKDRPELVDVVIGTTVADEGLDIPALDTLFLTCPLSLDDIAGEENASLLDQRIGRIGRVYKGKDDIRVFLYQDMFIDYFNRACMDIIAYLIRKQYSIVNLN